MAVPQKVPAGLRAQIALAVAMMLALLKVFEIMAIRFS